MGIHALLLPLSMLLPAASAAVQFCTDSCGYANDGECDDGGLGASTRLCPLGSDCTDCGPRSASLAQSPLPPDAPPHPLPPPPLCADTESTDTPLPITTSGSSGPATGSTWG